ncbi:hypothetical protein [Ornithinimicrobium kibberense]|uniref:hypothetical protein n=1 Tax=Ornithinimicrobium kibberense TaxID=282060 RepID=UPI0036086CBE
MDDRDQHGRPQVAGEGPGDGVLVAARRRGQQHGGQHETRPGGGGHQEGPPGQLPGSQPHPHPTEVPRPQQLHGPDDQQDERDGAQGEAAGDLAGEEGDDQGGRQHRQLVAQHDPRQRAQQGPPALLLQPVGQREQPAHGRVDAVEEPQPQGGEQGRDVDRTAPGVAGVGQQHLS